MSSGPEVKEGKRRPLGSMVRLTTDTPEHWNCWSWVSHTSVSPPSAWIRFVGSRAVSRSNWHWLPCLVILPWPMQPLNNTSSTNEQFRRKNVVDLAIFVDLCVLEERKWNNNKWRIENVCVWGWFYSRIERDLRVTHKHMLR